MTQSHAELPTFEPGRDQASIGTKWTKWLEVWELYLASGENDTIDTEIDDYVKSKTLKPLFLLKIGDEAREIYNSKRTLKRSVFAYVSIFYKAKIHEGESVNDYMV